jgi:hypothetical protein
MKTDEIAPLTTPSSNINRQPGSYQKRHEHPSNQGPASFKQDVITTSPLDHAQLNRIDQTIDSAHEFAQQVRNVHITMDAIGQNLEQMRAALESIVKIYPPYPPESVQRVEALRQFSALRNMIDKLANPAHQNRHGKISNTPDTTSLPNNGLLRLKVRGKDLIIHHQPVHTGQSGLNIPEVSEDMSDEQLDDILTMTVTAQETLKSRRQNFLSDANRTLAMIHLQ